MIHCGRAACTNDLSGMRADAKWCSAACRERVRRGERAHITLTKSRGGPSGAQVSYRKAVEVLATQLVVTDRRPGIATLDGARRVAEGLMREALSDRQRARLDERSRS